MEEFTIEVKAIGSYTKDELKEYLMFSLGFSSLSQDSPFISEDKDAEVTDIYIY